ncbi:MAG: hypothetical protein J6A84_03190 [Clostridia bacterium]|nr:hypothetical protein [Clostridia bacterium]
MYIELIAEILLALLAVFGLYAMIRLFVTSRLLPTRMGLAIEIRAGTEARDIPFLLDRVRDALFLCGARRIVALVDDSHAENTALLEQLRDANVKYYFVKL